MSDAAFRVTRLVYTGFIATWFVVYADRFGPSFVLWFCCAANLLAVAGLWLERPLPISMAAVSVFVIQALFAIDLASRLLVGRHLVGGTEYVFDASRPLELRVLTLHHLVTPLVVLFALRRFGYDRRALLAQSALAVLLVVAGYVAVDPRTTTDDTSMPLVDGRPFDRDYDVNWSHGLFDRPDPRGAVPALAWLLFVYPLIVHLPTHLALSRLGTKRPAA